MYAIYIYIYIYMYIYSYTLIISSIIVMFGMSRMQCAQIMR